MSDDSPLFSVLPQLACNPMRDLVEGATQRGLINLVFPNGEAMTQWFKSLAESGKELSVFAELDVDLSKFGFKGNPIGPIIPINIPGITKGPGR